MWNKFCCIFRGKKKKSQVVSDWTGVALNRQSLDREGDKYNTVKRYGITYNRVNYKLQLLWPELCKMRRKNMKPYIAPVKSLRRLHVCWWKIFPDIKSMGAHARRALGGTSWSRRNSYYVDMLSSHVLLCRGAPVVTRAAGENVIRPYYSRANQIASRNVRFKRVFGAGFEKRFCCCNLRNLGVPYHKVTSVATLPCNTVR